MTIKEIVEQTKEFEIGIEKNRQEAAFAAREFWNILEYPQVVDNQEEIQKRWQNVANALADLREIVGEYNELMGKEVKD